MIWGVVLAAGRSTRMGEPKLVLPWTEGITVIGSVVGALREGGVEPIVVVVGADREAVEAALAGTGVRFVVNPDAEAGEMLSSIQTGVGAVGEEATAVMLTPGDLPAIRASTVAELCRAWEKERHRIAAPVHGSRRGHPVVVPRTYWKELLGLGPEQSLRSFLRRHEPEVVRIEVDDAGIRADVDTPDDYRAARRLPPAGGGVL